MCFVPPTKSPSNARMNNGWCFLCILTAMSYFIFSVIFSLLYAPSRSWGLSLFLSTLFWAISLFSFIIWLSVFHQPSLSSLPSSLLPFFTLPPSPYSSFFPFYIPTKTHFQYCSVSTEGVADCSGEGRTEKRVIKGGEGKGGKWWTRANYT